MNAELLAGRYELVATVGKGATGQVWRAFDTLLHRQIAIKVVQLEGARDPAMAERFRREGIAIAGLNHESIVQVFDAGTDERRGWLVMEFLNGPNLNTVVHETGPLSYEIGMPMLARVADGLQAAHDAGITHRDVKPANIMLDAAREPNGDVPDLLHHPELGRPVLIDFGIARLVDQAGAQLTRPATAIGTAAYMSPEQARGQETGPASDVYSLACVAYHTFLGRPPFLGSSSVAVAHAQAYDAPVPLGELAPDVPPALDNLLSRMLMKDAAARPSAREVATELRAITRNPEMAPTETLAGLPTAVMPTQATAVLDDPTQPTRVLADAPEPGIIAPATGPTAMAADQTYPALTPAQEEAEKRSSSGGFRNAGRWLVALLVIGLLAALGYTWATRGDSPQPAATVTMVTTATPTEPTTTAPQTTATTQPPTTQAPPPAPPTTTAPVQPTTQAPSTTAEPTQPPTTAPTTQAPPTTEQPAPPTDGDTPGG